MAEEITNQEILNEVKNLSGKVEKIYGTLFGPDGMTGLVRVAIDLQSTVYGNPASPDDNGLTGDVHYVKDQIDGNGRDGMKSRVNVLEDARKTDAKSQRRWNTGLSMAQIITWIAGIFLGIKS